MSIGPLGNNLIFLISQPRAGSTLTQRILASHPKVHTVSEPWLMLHPLYARRREGITSEYIHRHAHTALEHFLEHAGGEDLYFEALRRMYSYLYDQSLIASGKSVFVDKTPRYYLILPELVRTFPEARFILLVRHPLAVLSSMVRTWAPDGKLFHLERWKKDLFEAPLRLVEGRSLIEERGAVLHFEEMLADPLGQIRALCPKIGLNFVPEMINYGSGTLPTWKFGDAEQVYCHQRPEAANADRWLEDATDPQMWRILNDYFDALGPQTLSTLGYDPERCRKQLEKLRPARWRSCLTFSLTYLCDPGSSRKRKLIWFVRQLRRRGLIQALRRSIVVAFKRIIHGRPDGAVDLHL